jgi:hypothetical protein
LAQEFVNREGGVVSVASAKAAALQLAAQGLHCFPCEISKRPASPHGFKDASADAATLSALWRKYPGELVGVATGKISGIDVLDLDVDHLEAERWWESNRYRLPTTRIHQTRSGGLHLLFQQHDNIRCTAGKIALGVDTRGAGGYIIWWPVTGLPILSNAAPATWPDWFLSEFPAKPRLTAPISRIPDNHLIGSLVRLVAGASEGERNSLTFWAGCRMSEMVGSGLLSADAAVAVIAEAATRAGLPRAEAERTARNGICAGDAHHA